MFVRKLVFMLLVALLPALPTAAQQPASLETWYFGWDNESGQLVAYTPTGTVNPLLTIDLDVQPQGWRLAPDRALALLAVGGIPNLYILTPQGAQPMTAADDAAAFLTFSLRVAARQDPYLVLMAETGAFGVGLLVDQTVNTLSLLSGEVYTTLDNWRFSADGALLRYLSRESRDSNDWTLWERTLATGTERALYTFASPYPTIQADRTGDHWVYRDLRPDSRVLVHTVIFADGAAQALAEEAVGDPITTFTAFQFFGDDLLVYTAPCSAACQIERRPLAGGTPQTFALSAIKSPAITPLAQVNETRLLVLIEDELWLLDSAAAGTRLGTYSAVTFATPSHNLVSPDSQWLLALDTPTTYRLWYLPTSVIALEGEVNQAALAQFASSGVLISQFTPRSTVFYRFADGQRFDLPHNSNDFYAEALPDGTLLYVQADENAPQSAGVYLYSPDSGTTTLLVANLFPLVLE